MNIVIGAEQSGWIEPTISVGAVLLGAVLAWGTSYFFESKRLKQEQKGIAYSLIFKILFFADEVWKLDREILAAIARANEDGPETPLWTKMQEVIGFEENPERITAKELALVADTQDAELVIKVMEFESGHSILMKSIRKIQQLRNQLTDLKLAQLVDGRVISFGGPSADHPNYAHLFIHLNDLSAGLVEQTSRICEAGREIAGKVGPHLKKHYKFKHFVTLAMAPASGLGGDGEA